MSKGGKTRDQSAAPTRRQAIATGAFALAGLAVGSASAETQRAMPETQSTGADKARTFLHQEVDFKASPHRIYEILLDSKQFAAFTGLPANISREPGGAFTMFGGLIEGRNIELVPDQRIVQAWRPANWDPGDYSIVKFQLKEKGSQTTVVLDHAGFHEGDFGHLDSGWHTRYWEPLAKFLA
ncbi:MAG TPA: SRPBCC family protein [Candidatus Acidoferrales bacterium]|nr:SRPBCC family protein [Candidatus Acidoferrales bacterium]